MSSKSESLSAFSSFEAEVSFSVKMFNNFSFRLFSTFLTGLEMESENIRLLRSVCSFSRANVDA
jgi:hypothetical protein